MLGKLKWKNQFEEYWTLQLCLQYNYKSGTEYRLGIKRRFLFAVKLDNGGKLIRKTKPSGNTAEASSEGIKIVVETFIFMLMQILQFLFCPLSWVHLCGWNTWRRVCRCGGGTRDEAVLICVGGQYFFRQMEASHTKLFVKLWPWFLRKILIASPYCLLRKRRGFRTVFFLLLRSN